MASERGLSPFQIIHNAPTRDDGHIEATSRPPHVPSSQEDNHPLESREGGLRRDHQHPRNTPPSSTSARGHENAYAGHYTPTHDRGNYNDYNGHGASVPHAPPPVHSSQEDNALNSREGGLRRDQQRTRNTPPSSTRARGQENAYAEHYTPAQDRSNLNADRDTHNGHGSWHAGDSRPGLGQRTESHGYYNKGPYFDYQVRAQGGKWPSSIASRLKPTIEHATEQKDIYAAIAQRTKYLLNIAIALQILLGSLTTGLSAAATSGKSAAIQTTILGALSTVVASYLASARGSGEPDASNTRRKNLEHFIRDAEAFLLDHGDDVVWPNDKLDAKVEKFRETLEVLLGNTGDNRGSGNGNGNGSVNGNGSGNGNGNGNRETKPSLSQH